MLPYCSWKELCYSYYITAESRAEETSNNNTQETCLDDETCNHSTPQKIERETEIEMTSKCDVEEEESVPSCKAYPSVWWVGRERSDIFGRHMTRQLEPASPEFLHPLLLLFTNIKSRLHSRRGHRLLLNDIFSPLHIGLVAPTSLSKCHFPQRFGLEALRCTIA